MLPHLGAGAGQGIESAFVLTRLLSHPQTNSSNIKPVLEAYNRIRWPHSQMVSKASETAGDTYDGCGKHCFTPEGIRADLNNQWTPIWHHDVNVDVQAAAQWLQETGVFT